MLCDVCSVLYKNHEKGVRRIDTSGGVLCDVCVWSMLCGVLVVAWSRAPDTPRHTARVYLYTWYHLRKACLVFDSLVIRSFVFLRRRVNEVESSKAANQAASRFKCNDTSRPRVHNNTSLAVYLRLALGGAPQKILLAA